MIGLISLFVALAVSMLIVRIGGVALRLTGLSDEAARFQALSAFSGSGFTTAEAEHVVRHPVRRRIVALLIRLGNAGLITVMSSLVLSFLDVGRSAQGLVNLLWLVMGVGAFWLVARSRWLDQRLSHIIEWALARWTDLEVCDYAEVLRLQEDYAIMELYAEPGHWAAGKSLAELQLAQEGINVLGIQRKEGHYVGCPEGKTFIYGGDVLLLYGRKEVFEEFDQRIGGAEGDTHHREAVERQEAVRQEQEERDRQARQRGQSGPGVDGEA